jgi:uncharacterized protein
MLRRDFTRALGALALAPVCVAASDTAAAKPPFWLARQRRARVYLLGFGEAHDRSWLTPSIRQAFESSSQLWLEIDQSRPIEEINPVIQKYGNDPSRTFLDSLEPRVRERAIAYMNELEIKPESVRTMRPWFAYYTFAMAFSARNKKNVAGESPEAVLAGLAKQTSKKIGYEMSMAALVESLASMPDKAQSQYIRWLFDYFDEQKAGPADHAGWITGNTASGMRSLKRMAALPALYRIMQVERNGWWARKIQQLLESQQTHFVAVGQLHVLGPDGIPRELWRRGVDLTANPT